MGNQLNETDGYIRSRDSKSAFLWGDLDPDQWSKITRIMVHQRNRRIHSRSRIHRFLWCTMIQTDLGSLLLIQITSKKRNLKRAHLTKKMLKKLLSHSTASKLLHRTFREMEVFSLNYYIRRPAYSLSLLDDCCSVKSSYVTISLAKIVCNLCQSSPSLFLYDLLLSL